MIAHYFSSVGWDSVGHSTGWTVRGSNPGGGEIFRTLPDRPWASLLYNGYRVSFAGVKRPGRGTDHPPQSSITLLPLWAFMAYSSVKKIYFFAACCSLFDPWSSLLKHAISSVYISFLFPPSFLLHVFLHFFFFISSVFATLRSTH